MSKILPKLHLACAPDDSLSIPMKYIFIKDNIAYATEGHLIICVNLKFHSDLTPDVLEKLNGKYIHKNTWKKIFDAVELRIENDEIIYSDANIQAKFEYENDVKYPDVEKLLSEIILEDETNDSHFGFTPKILDILFKVFDNDQIFFMKKKVNFLVYPSVGSYQFGMVCPVGINDGGFKFDFNIQ